MIRMTIAINKMHKITTKALMIVSDAVVESMLFKHLSVSSRDEFTEFAPLLTAGIVFSQNETLGSPKCCFWDMNVGNSDENFIYSRNRLVYVGHRECPCGFGLLE